MIDVCESNMVSKEDFLPEHVWIIQPLDAKSKRLPLTRVQIEGEFEKVITKAAIKPAELSQDLYLMGNRAAKLIEEKKLVNKIPNVSITRNQDEENAEVKDENQFLESKEKILTRDENEKEKSE